jgi:hypothetical protein
VLQDYVAAGQPIVRSLIGVEEAAVSLNDLQQCVQPTLEFHSADFLSLKELPQIVQFIVGIHGSPGPQITHLIV